MTSVAVLTNSKCEKFKIKNFTRVQERALIVSYTFTNVKNIDAVDYVQF